MAEQRDVQLRRIDFKFGTLEDDLGPPLSHETAFHRFRGLPTLVASPHTPFWLKETIYGSPEAEALCGFLPGPRRCALLRIERGGGDVSGVAICRDDAAFAKTLANTIATTQLRFFPASDGDVADLVSSSSEEVEDLDSDDSCGEPPASVAAKMACRRSSAVCFDDPAALPACPEDPEDVQGWLSWRGFAMIAEPTVRLSTLETCFRGLSAFVASPTFPHDVRTTRFGTADCRARCLEAREANEGLTAIVGLDRYYPAWIAICGRSQSRPLDVRGLMNYVYSQEAMKPQEDERQWIERRIGSCECEDLSSYIRRWWPSRRGKEA